tara:strand:- start:26 stop:253 length:228 start_codon:yes stop_codon:yes gene_type:complete
MKLLAYSTSLLITFGLCACDVDKTQEGKMPSVDVETEGGQLPKYDVDGPDVSVGTKEKTITVPDIDVDLPKDDDQ